MQTEAQKFVDQGADGAATQTRLTALMRYAGQGWEIPVPLPYRAFGPEDREMIGAAFAEAYETLFGRTIDGLAVEIANWSLVVTTTPPAPDIVARRENGTAHKTTETRSFYDAALRAQVTATEVSRAAMGPGLVVDGPAVIVEAETSTIVTSAFRAVGQSDGSLLLVRKEPAP